ncbi:hypothetical protein GYB22_06485 [bacterium]|nr:hypothetical protein [bacterium]
MKVLPLALALLALISCSKQHGPHDGTYVTKIKINNSAQLYIIEDSSAEWYTFNEMTGVVKFDAPCIQYADSIVFPENGGVFKPIEEGLVNQSGIKLHLYSRTTGYSKKEIERLLLKLNETIE